MRKVEGSRKRFHLDSGPVLNILERLQAEIQEIARTAGRIEDSEVAQPYKETFEYLDRFPPLGFPLSGARSGRPSWLPFDVSELSFSPPLPFDSERKSAPSMRSKARQGETGCSGRSIPMDKLDGIVARHIEERLLQPDRLEDVLAEVLDRRQEQGTRRREQLAELRMRIEDTKIRLKRLP